MEKFNQQALEQEYQRNRHNQRLIAASAFMMLTVGAVFFHYVEHWKLLDSFYFCTVTLATVGYGDLAPHTDAGKLFDIFYIIGGIGILAAFANLLIKNASMRRELRHRAKEKKK